MKKKQSISDIAKALGISTTTVSFVLNGKAKEKRISDALSKRVVEYVEKVGYRPNELAKSLRTGKTKIIGLIIEDISNPFFANIARLIEGKAYSHGYRIIYCSTENKTAKTNEFIRLFRDKQVDGFIITPPVAIEQTVQSLLSEQIPLVLLDRYLPGVDSDYVVVNNHDGALNATQHLIDQGFRRIGFVTTTSAQTQMRDRLIGYQRATKQSELKQFVYRLSISEEDPTNYKTFLDFVKNNQLDALFFSANHLAVGALKGLYQAKVKLPGLISFDDHVHFRLSKPTISVVSQPISQIADEVINSLFLQLEGKATRPRHVVLPTKLIPRDSTSRPFTVPPEETSSKSS